MMRRILGTAALLVAVAATARPAAAQGYELGYTDIGPTLGLGGIGSASLTVGARFERAIRTMPDLGDGIIGIMVGADYYSFDYAYGFGNSSITYIPIGATANYHFKLSNEKIDPFLGLGLGYQIVSASCTYQGIDYCSGVYSSAVYFIGRAGARYFLNDRVALYGDLGAGAATLNVGATFRVN